MKNIEKQSPMFQQNKSTIAGKEQTSKPKLLVLVVLYKKTILESPTIKSLLSQHKDLFELELVIWDNSPERCPDDQIYELEQDFGKFQYRWSPENTWLSKLYNQVLSARTYDYALLLDQDTDIPPYYFDKLGDALFKFPKIALFLPLVLHEEKVVSPGSWVYFKGKHWKKIKTGILPAKNVLAITSGMVISAKVFFENQMKFDERLSLYGIDTGFMLNFSKFEKELYVLPIKFDHDTVLWSNPSADVMLIRFRNLKSTWPKILSDRPVARTLVYFYSMAVSFKLALKYQDLRFLK
ncbi:glycosyltransferase [Pedobacter sp. N36a]|uniref:glycosyltransferase n=1 Tax=Pedobacter sp. N36a TaxID=2767996 RepID=UPI0016569BF1|nr:glycosyltransferase [Pedobacter sp. N36a]MBC8986060.1 glycosyltransferase [Pedobacter sp. N36a]